MNVVAIIQARLGSSRLPGKVLKTVMGKPLLEYQIERVSRARHINKIVVATSDLDRDLPIVKFCERLLVLHYRGSEEDVLERYYDAALSHRADVIVRLTADCPLIDPQLIDEVIESYIQSYPQYDYVSNCLQRTYPRGMDVEVFSFKALYEAYRRAKSPSEREHVTPFIYKNPQIFKLHSIKNAKNQSNHRWTVDTPEDFTLVKNILETIYPVKQTFTLHDCLDVLEKHPDWMNINAEIHQKDDADAERGTFRRGRQ